MQSHALFPPASSALFVAGVALLGLAACGQSQETTDASSATTPKAVIEIDPDRRVTTSGVASGAYMAVQAHVALADQITGVAAVAGGPWHCAEGSESHANGRCMSGEGLDVSTLIAYAYELAASVEIAGVDALAKSRVYVFHSPDDAVVSPRLSEGLVAFYAAFVRSSAVRFVDDVIAAHGWPKPAQRADCGDASGEPDLACEYDAAGDLLKHLYGRLEPRDAGAAGRKLSTIDLSQYFAAGSGVADDAFTFSPAECTEEGAVCRLHIVFHGCRMGAEFMGDRFALGTGLNEWAASNGIVVLYPQVASSARNPQGCWDWWGYSGRNYDRKSGKQVAGVARIVAAFAAGTL